MNLVAYLRVSSETQLDGFGLPEQERAVKAWAKSAGHKVVLVCADEGKSGSLDIHDRPGLSAAIDALGDGTAGGLIIARLDRLARALAVQEAALAVAWKRGASVFAADQGEVHKDDPDDPMRTAMRQMMGVFAQLDRAQVVKRLRDGRRAKADSGRKATGAYPFGYTGEGKGRERDAAPHDEEQAAVARILELRRAGDSYRTIAELLDAEGYRPRRAETWSAMTVRNIVTRESQPA